jgi:hypothetical protein
VTVLIRQNGIPETDEDARDHEPEADGTPNISQQPAQRLCDFVFLRNQISRHQEFGSQNQECERDRQRSDHRDRRD